MIDKALRVLTALPGLLFVISGLQWIIDPDAAARSLGMPLLEGIGRSSQIGDMSAFFLTLGSLILAGVITRRRVWFYPPMMLLGIAAMMRIVAWVVHDASLAVSFILVELVVTLLLMVASFRLGRADNQ